MKKLLASIIFSAVFTLMAAATFGQDFKFRGFPWGASLDSVIAVEGQPDFTESYSFMDSYRIYYNDKYVSLYKATLGLTFSTKHDTLLAGMYVIKTHYASSQEIYDDVLNKLTIQYGERLPKDKIDPLLQRRYESSTISFWISGKTMITLSVAMNAYDETNEASVIISYLSPGVFPNIYGDF